jgi:hypothetical protein
MINFVIVFDNQNPILGKYFEECKKDIVTLLDEQSHLVNSCHKAASNQCNVAYIDIVVPQINDNPFVFIAYTHGTDDALICNGNAFVSIDSCCCFCNSLFYSNACLIGKKLALELISIGCKTFIGYREESKVFFADETYKKICMDADNLALKLFLTEDGMSIGESVESVRKFYTTKLEYYLDIDPIFAGILTANRDALVCLGDKNLKKEDLFLAS